VFTYTTKVLGNRQVLYQLILASFVLDQAKN